MVFVPKTHAKTDWFFIIVTTGFTHGYKGIAPLGQGLRFTK